MHGGGSGGAREGSGAPENNDNAVRHDLFSDWEKLYQRLPDAQQHHVDRVVTALIERYESRHGEEPDYQITQDLKHAGVDVHKQTLADNYLVERMIATETENVLSENTVIGVNEDDQPIRQTQPNDIIREASRLKSDTRMLLKDLGLLPDPESKQAEAVEGVISILSSERSGGN